MIRLDEDWTGKRIFLKTEKGKIINGIVIKHENGFLKIKDKFSMILYIMESEIELLEEKK